MVLSTSKSGWKNIIRLTTLVTLALTITAPKTLHAESAASVTKAIGIFNNLNGVTLPPTNSTIVSMANMIDLGNTIGAAQTAAADDRFISNTVFPFASVMTTRTENRSVPLSDFSATWMGYARDGLDARGLFTNPVIYSFQGVSPAPAASNNLHYVQAQNLYQYQDVSTSATNTLAKMLVAGSPTIKVGTDDSAGVLSYARGWFWDFAVNGTNRKLFEETLREFECVTLQSVGDENQPSDRIRQDVDPTSVNYQTTCLHCHAVQDAMNPFNYFAYTNNMTGVSNTSGQIAYAGTPAKDTGALALFDPLTGMVAAKVIRNSQVNPLGYRNTDSSWQNHCGANNPNCAALGMDANSGGPGLASYGQLIANSSGFAACMAKRAFSQLCLRKDFSVDAMSTSDYKFLSSNASTISSLATVFSSSGYNLKTLFENTAIQPQCLP